eukprot:3297989-Prymnesium_polylepis.3
MRSLSPPTLAVGILLGGTCQVAGAELQALSCASWKKMDRSKDAAEAPPALQSSDTGLTNDEDTLKIIEGHNLKLAIEALL